MIAYKNTSLATKTFYGVTFKPGEVKEVPGYINDDRLVRVESVPEEPPKRTERKTADMKSAKSSTTKQIKEED